MSSHLYRRALLASLLWAIVVAIAAAMIAPDNGEGIGDLIRTAITVWAIPSALFIVGARVVTQRRRRVSNDVAPIASIPTGSSSPSGPVPDVRVNVDAMPANALWLIILGFGAMVVGLLFLSVATAAPTLLGVACFLGIWARVVQAAAHHRMVMREHAATSRPLPHM